MHDQADELRQLVRRGSHDAPAGAERPRLVAVCGSRPGVGATAVAFNVAISLARSGRRAIYVDAGQRSSLAASHRTSNAPLAELLDGRRSLYEVLAPGPGGIRVLPDAWGAMHETASLTAVQQRLISEFKGIGRHTDAILLDAGSGASLAVRRFCQSADRVLLVTTDENSSVMDAYAVLKIILAGDAFEKVSIVVNRAAEPRTGRFVYERLSQVCQQYLGGRPPLAGCVVADSAVSTPREQPPLLLHDAPAAQGSGPTAARGGPAAAQERSPAERGIDAIAAALLTMAPASESPPATLSHANAECR